MLTLLLGTDWTANRDAILNMLSADVAHKLPNRILLVPELISHDMERRLCKFAGNTCSRYAEVLSFSRLTHRICEWVQCPMQECMDNGGRLIAMASAARQLHSKLKAYAAVETRPEFLSGLVDAIDEFKRCCISSEDLLAASLNTSGSFAQKLEELSLLLSAYDGICNHGKRDPRDQLTWGLEQLMECNFAQEHTFYIDGFPDFTRQNLAVISWLIQSSENVTISLNCDKVASKHLAFAKAGETASILLRIAQEHHIPVSVQYISPHKSPFHPLCAHLFQGSTDITLPETHTIRLVQADSIYEECVLATDQILELIHKGARYNEISLVCPDLTAYANAIQMQLDACQIPGYIAGTEDILNMSVISTVLTALDVALNGFETKDVLRYLKSALSPLDLEACDRLENYVILWGIDGKKWLTPWNYNPAGLQETWKEQDIDLLHSINCSREKVIEPLKKLAYEFKNASNLSRQVDALRVFLTDIQLDHRLQLLAEELNLLGDNRNAQIINQLWDILLMAMDQLQDTLGETTWDNEVFSRLFRILLSQYDVGTIPPVIDTVTIGPTSAMRCQQTKHLIVIGASEGNFPNYGGISGVLTDQERNALRQMGVPLTGGSAEGLEVEFSEIYGVFCGATESIYVSCPSGNSSFIYRRLLNMVREEWTPKDKLGSICANSRDAASYLIRHGDFVSAEHLGLSDLYKQTKKLSAHQLGKVQQEHIQGLYGNCLNLSASQIDKISECRLAYFLKYGLRAKERKPISVDPAEFGTYVHAVLEETAREICELGGFKSVTLEHCLEIAQKHSSAYINQHFSQIDSNRITYLFQRNQRELMMIMEELWSELQNSSFAPLAFEVAFGNGEQLNAIPIPSGSIPAQLRGYVDRVDIWNEDGRNYFRVIDYKTGKKDFDYCDILNGIGLQMLLYLFALEQDGECLLGEHAIPAGVQYFPARVPVLSADGPLTDEEAGEIRLSTWKRKGLILCDEDVIFAMENSEKPVRLNCKRKKDGTLTGDIATREQFKTLCKYIFKLLGKMVDDIASGNVEPNPYTRGSSYNACRYCPYTTVCNAATVDGRRNYKSVSAQSFWDTVEKGVE